MEEIIKMFAQYIFYTVSGELCYLGADKCDQSILVGCVYYVIYTLDEITIFLFAFPEACFHLKLVEC